MKRAPYIVRRILPIILASSLGTGLVNGCATNSNSQETLEGRVQYPITKDSLEFNGPTESNEDLRIYFNKSTTNADMLMALYKGTPLHLSRDSYQDEIRKSIPVQNYAKLAGISLEDMTFSLEDSSYVDKINSLFPSTGYNERGLDEQSQSLAERSYDAHQILNRGLYATRNHRIQGKFPSYTLSEARNLDVDIIIPVEIEGIPYAAIGKVPKDSKTSLLKRLIK
jgi:hypothetical protein